MGLVEHTHHLLVMVRQGVDDFLELVRDVQLVCVEKEQDEVSPLAEPSTHATEIVPSGHSLLVAAQNARCVDEVKVSSGWRLRDSYTEL